MQTETALGGSGTLKFLKAMTVLAIIGAINWGLIGLFNFNLVDAILGGGSHEETSLASRIVYSLVGLAGIASLFLLPAKHSDVTHHGPTHRVV